MDVWGQGRGYSGDGVEDSESPLSESSCVVRIERSFVVGPGCSGGHCDGLPGA